MSKHDFNNVDVTKLVVPPWLTELKKIRNYIAKISDIQLTPYSAINLEEENPARKGGISDKDVNEIKREMKEDGWRPGSEPCILIEMENPPVGSSWLYSIYFTLHRHSAGFDLQVEAGVVKPVLPSVVVTLKPGLSKPNFDRAIIDMANLENINTTKKLVGRKYSDADKVYNVVKYLETFPNLTTPVDKLAHLTKVWRKEQMDAGVHHATVDAIIAKAKDSIGIVDPMVRYSNKKLRNQWTEFRYDNSFEYCGNQIIKLNFDAKSDEIQYPFGDDRGRFIRFWHQDHWNRQLGDLIEFVTYQHSNGDTTPVMVFPDAHDASGVQQLDNVRRKRIEQIERQLSYLKDEIRSMIHMVAFVPHDRSGVKESMNSLISYQKLRREFKIGE